MTDIYTNYSVSFSSVLALILQIGMKGTVISITVKVCECEFLFFKGSNNVVVQRLKNDIKIRIVDPDSNKYKSIDDDSKSIGEILIHKTKVCSKDRSAILNQRSWIYGVH